MADTIDYTIVLKGGTAFKSTDNGDTTTEVLTMEGLTYDANTGWMMENLTFTTTADTAMFLMDADTTITVSGTNTVTSGSGTDDSSYIMALMGDADPDNGNVGSNLTIQGAATGTNTLTFQSPDTTIWACSTYGIKLNEGSVTTNGVLTIGDNVTVTVSAGNSPNEGYSNAVDVVGLAISGTGKLIAHAGENSTDEATAIYLDTEPDVTVKNTVDETTPVWDYNSRTYMNGQDTASNLTLTAVEPGPSITISAGLEFVYDNTNVKVLDLDAGEYSFSGLDIGDKVVDVTITTNSANAGTYTEDMYTLSYKIVNAQGMDISHRYQLIENTNDIDITQRTITIAADSASKVYDGTALTASYTLEEGATEEYQLLDGEIVKGISITADSTITHVGSTANKIDASNITITKADGSDSSMNYIINTEDGTLAVTARGVLLQSTSADKYYDGTALQNRQVAITGFHYDSTGSVIVDTEDAGFLDGDGCTYDFVGDNVVIDKDGNVIAWTVSEQSYTAYGQTEVGSSKNEFNYNNFTSVYYKSYESDYTIMYGGNQESLGLSKDDTDLFGDLTVWGGPVEINMTDYSWTYDYQAKTNGYYDDGYTVIFTTNEEGTETEVTEFAHNSEGEAVALFGKDTIVVTVTPEGGSVDTGKVQHVGDDTENTATYTIYRNGEDVTEEVEEYYQLSVTGGTLKITPRTVEIASASDSKRYDGEELVDRTIIEGSEGRDKGFIFGEGAAYEISGSQTEIGTSKNTFAISELLTDTQASDYNFVMTEGVLTVTRKALPTDMNGNGISDILFQNLDASTGNALGAWTDADPAQWVGDIGTAPMTDWTVYGAYELTGDDCSDVLFRSKSAGTAYAVGIFDRSSGASEFKTIGWGVTDAWNLVKVGDADGNQIGDILWQNSDNGYLGLWMNGTNQWIGLPGSKLEANQKVFGFADANGDGQGDILINSNGTLGAWDIAGILDNTAETPVWTGFGISVAEDTTIVGSGDLDANGLADIVIWKASGEVGVYMNCDAGDYRTVFASASPSEWALPGFGDYDGDGGDEILVRNVATGALGYWDNDDAFTWNAIGYGVDSSWAVLA